MMTLADAKRQIDAVSRPTGYNSYAWNVAQKIALEVWDCYLQQKPLRRNINYFCKEFYHMLRKPDGSFIVPESRFRTLS